MARNFVFIVTLYVVSVMALLPLRANAQEACIERGGIVPLCGFAGPEDMVHVPETPFLIVSQYGGVINRGSGNIVSFNTGTKEIQPLYPQNPRGGSVETLWGQKECVIPPQYFSPHGIDLVRRPDGDLMLLVVNHSELDSVQLFKVKAAENSLSLQWQGCVFMPNNLDLNDVTALPRGDIFVTAAKVTNKEPLNFLGGMYVLQWTPTAGLTTLLSREQGYANGIAVTKDGAALFFNDTIAGKVMKIALPGGDLLAEAAIERPDNLTWGADGNLWVMSILITSFKDQLPPCENNPNSHCIIPFKVSSLNPDTMQSQTLFAHDGQTVFGAGTVALQVDDDLYLGCAFGDRMAKIKVPEIN